LKKNNTVIAEVTAAQSRCSTEKRIEDLAFLTSARCKIDTCYNGEADLYTEKAKVSNDEAQPSVTIDTRGPVPCCCDSQQIPAH
jgi:hypothetical protein